MPTYRVTLRLEFDVEAEDEMAAAIEGERQAFPHSSFQTDVLCLDQEEKEDA